MNRIRNHALKGLTLGAVMLASIGGGVLAGPGQSAAAGRTSGILGATDVQRVPGGLMSDIPPAEPAVERTVNEIVSGKQSDDIEPTTEELERVYGYFWENPTMRLSTRIRNVFPQLQERANADCEVYDIQSDAAYSVVGEDIGESRQALGLNRGEAWVARFAGGWVGSALEVSGAWELARQHFREMHGCPPVG